MDPLSAARVHQWNVASIAYHIDRMESVYTQIDYPWVLASQARNWRRASKND